MNRHAALLQGGEDIRRLAVVCGAFAAGVFLAQYLLPESWLFPLALTLALPGIALILLRRRWLLPLILSLCSLAAGFYFYGMFHMLTLERAHALDGAELVCSGTVLTPPTAGSGSTRVELRFQIDEKTRLTGYLYDTEGTLKNARPGDLVTGCFQLNAADTRNGERYDTDPARGIYLTAKAKGALSLEKGRGFHLRGFAAQLNQRLCSRIRTLFPDDTEAFFQALLLGDKTALYQNDVMHLSLSRAGLMHMVAVSGMHVAFLVGMLRHLLGNTRRASVLSLLLIWCFVLLTGANPSAVRAGLMQTIVLLAPIFGREDDPPTSMLFALAVILLGNPFAAGSVGLQLSFASLAGILLFSDRLRSTLYDGLPRWMPRWLGNTLASSFANSLAVLVFSAPLIALHFGTVSVLSPLSNLLTLWAVPFCFGLGFGCCLLSLVWMSGACAAAAVLSWPARYILFIAKTVSTPGFACLYLCLKWNWLWLALVYLFVIGANLLFCPGWKRWFYPGALALFSLFALLTATRLYYSSAPGYMTAVDVGQGQSLVVIARDKTLVIDCGNINATEDAGDLTGSYLCSRGRESVDLLILTHLHADHADGVTRLLAWLPVREILVGPALEDPNGLLPQIRETAGRYGTRISTLSTDRCTALGNIDLQLFLPGQSGNINERCVTARIGIDGYDMLVTGDVNAAAERELLRRHELSDIELLIVGHHGSKYASSKELLAGIDANEAIISCGFNSFGHPTAETLERLEKFEYTVHRTDLDGTVEIRIP